MVFQLKCRELSHSAASNILLYLTDAKFTKYLKLCTHPASFLREYMKMSDLNHMK